MTKLSTTLALLSLTALPLVSINAEDTTKDSVQTKLQGRWEIVAGTNQGQELSEAEVSGTYVTITNNSIITYDRDDRARYQAVFTLDTEMQPVQITMRAVSKEEPVKAKSKDNTKAAADKAAAGILKFDGDKKVKLCYSLSGDSRPTEFKSPEGSQIMLFSLERKEDRKVPETLEPIR